MRESGYRTARWSPLSLGLTLFVQALPVVIGLWVWRPASVQLAPSTPIAVFDVPAPETPLPDAPAEPEQAAETPAPPTPPTPAQTAEVAPEIALPAAIPIPAKAAQPAAPPVPAARPAPRPPSPAAPSQKPADWQSLVLGRLNAVKAYPGSARARRQQGTVLIRFTLDRQGAVLQVALARTSGFALLDREALALPKRAAPLPAPPPDMAGERIELVVPVEFYF